MFSNLDQITLLVILFSLCLGGFTKGVISWGFPVISLPILTIVLPPTSALFLLFFPIIFANIREINFKNMRNYKKLIPFSIGIFSGILIGSYIFHNTKSEIISIAIGITIIIFAFINFKGFKINEILVFNKLFGLLYGLFSGVIGGMTTVLGPLMIIYLVSLNFSKERFSQNVSFLVFATLIPLYIMFFIYQKVVVYDFLVTSLALIPAMFMQYIGLKIRDKIPQETFKNLTLIFLTFVGLLVLYKHLL
ncbi:sulfite exporter TauE/SafE family protein [Alphaproteobacteria bacterium]|nr:sulfite exporter TauE/SafE family protein [Alphaproteobacteria bacterium]